MRAAMYYIHYVVHSTIYISSKAQPTDDQTTGAVTHRDLADQSKVAKTKNSENHITQSETERPSDHIMYKTLPMIVSSKQHHHQ